MDKDKAIRAAKLTAKRMNKKRAGFNQGGNPNSIMNLDPKAFMAALDELGIQGEERNRLLGMYRDQTATGKIASALRGDVGDGMTRRNVLPIATPQGVSGAEALMSGDFEWAVPGMISSVYQAPADAIEAYDAASSGLPVSEEELNQKMMDMGFAIAGSKVIARPAAEAIDAAQRAQYKRFMDANTPSQRLEAFKGRQLYEPTHNEAALMQYDPMTLEQIAYWQSLVDSDKLLQRGASAQEAADITGILRIPRVSMEGDILGTPREPRMVTPDEMAALRPDCANNYGIPVRNDVRPDQGTNLAFFDDRPGQQEIWVNPLSSPEHQAMARDHEMIHADQWRSRVPSEERGTNVEDAADYRLQSLNSLAKRISAESDPIEKSRLSEQFRNLRGSSSDELYSRNPGELYADAAIGNWMAKRLTPLESLNPYLNKDKGLINRALDATAQAALGETTPWMSYLERKGFRGFSDRGAHAPVPLDVSKAVIGMPPIAKNAGGSVGYSTGGALELARAVMAKDRAGGQIAPSKYQPNVPRAVHADGGRENGDAGGMNLYRGTNDSGERITGGIGEGLFFGTPHEDVARLYGDQISQFELPSHAKVLTEGSGEFSQLTGRKKGPLLRNLRAGENLRDAANEAIARAKEAGYDAVHFNSMRDMGVAVLNPDILVKKADGGRSVHADGGRENGDDGIVVYQGRSKKGIKSFFNPSGQSWGTTQIGTANQFAGENESFYPRATPRRMETSYNGEVHRLRFNIKNPMRVSIKDTMWDAGKERDKIEEAKSKGHDGLEIYHNPEKSDFVAFNPDQVEHLDSHTPDTRSENYQTGGAVTDTDEFRNWFGNSVTHTNGEPHVLYTGTSKDKDFTSHNVGRHGAWFVRDPEAASLYAEQNDSQGYKREGFKLTPTNTASRVIPAYVRAENPYTGELPEEYLRDNYKAAQSDWFDTLRARGHDSWVPASQNGNLVVALKEPQQIKSIFNNGKFDPNQKHMNKADGGEVDNNVTDLSTVRTMRDINSGDHSYGAQNMFADLADKYAESKKAFDMAHASGAFDNFQMGDMFKYNGLPNYDPEKIVGFTVKHVSSSPNMTKLFNNHYPALEFETQDADRKVTTVPLEWFENNLHKYDKVGGKPKLVKADGGSVNKALALTRRFTKDGKSAIDALKPKGK